MGHRIHRFVCAVAFLLAVVVVAQCDADSRAPPFSGCLEHVANNGYGYTKFIRLADIVRRGDAPDTFEFEFYVASKQTFQLLLTPEPKWPSSVGTPYEIQNYNNQVFMLNRRNRMVAKINRNYILAEDSPVPMVLRWNPRIGSIELQVIGERVPFLQFVDQPLADVAFIAFGTHGPNSVRYMYACPRPVGGDDDDSADVFTSAKAASECDNVKLVSVDARSDEGPRPKATPLSRLVPRKLEADETLNIRMYVTLGSAQKTARLRLHSLEDSDHVGSPYYEIELGEDYTLWRRGLKVATRRPTEDLLADGRRVLFNISIKKNGMVHIWLDDLQTQTLRFMEEYPIDLRYVTFELGLWTYGSCA